MKNILIFSDGTANDTGGQADKPSPNFGPNSALSNVYRLYVATSSEYQSSINSEKQISFYDPGLGSAEESHSASKASVSALLPSSVYRGLSQATGLGITGNIVDCYDFLLEKYEPGDKIFLFGFSRGAYTVRSLGGLLSLLGVQKVSDGISEKKRRKIAKQSVAVYKIRDEKKRFSQAAEIRGNYHSVVPHAICVFDTVRALGIAVGITNIIGSVSELFAPHKFHNHRLDPNVPFAFQAISVDENRKHFSVELWESESSNHDAFEQRWFPGVHSDIGGSYPDGESGTGRDLGRMTLEWMLLKHEKHGTGLLVNIDAFDLKDYDRAQRYFLGEKHNERSKKRLGIIATGKLWPEGFRLRASKAPLEPDLNDPDRVGIIDERVMRRFKALSNYRPVALEKHPKFRDLYMLVS